jgi:putative addiction module CopG family antidote
MPRNTQPMSITLPHDMAAMVRAKVASGEYASESEVIRDGLRVLQARDAIVEKWLQDEIAKIGDEDAEDGGLGLRAEDFEEFLAKLRAARRRAAKPALTEQASQRHE